MKTRTRRHRLIVSAGCIAAVALFVTQGALNAQEQQQALTVGTYEPERVAQQTGLQQKMQQQMQGLQERMQSAQQQGDQAAMQQIQMQAQQIQQQVIREFEQDVNAAMPSVARETDVQIIAAEVAYTAPGIQTRDVTQAVVQQMNGATQPPGQAVPPQ